MGRFHPDLLYLVDRVRLESDLPDQLMYWGSAFSPLSRPSTPGAWWSASLRNSELSLPGDNLVEAGSYQSEMLGMGLLHHHNVLYGPCFFDVMRPAPSGGVSDGFHDDYPTASQYPSAPLTV